MLRVAGAAVVLALMAQSAFAAQKAAVFPFELVVPPREEDFFAGTAGPSAAEKARLAMVHAEFVRLLTASSEYTAVDLTPLAAQIEAQRPLQDCKGCEVELAQKAGADVAFVVLLEKASDTMLNLRVTQIDVARKAVLRNASAVVQGNTDDAWLGGVRWLVKNRLLAKVEKSPS